MPVSMQTTGEMPRAESPAQLLDAARREAGARLLPLLGQALHAEREALQEASADARGGGLSREQLIEDLAGLSVLGSGLLTHEQRWQRAMVEVFAAWPEPPAAHQHSEFSLLSDDELQVQLLGQPVADTIDRRHERIRDVLDKRLKSLAGRLQYRGRPSNPLAAQFVIDAFLQAFGSGDCGRRLRTALLHRYAQLLDPQLAALYDWFNQRLAAAGCELAGDSEQSALIAGFSRGVDTVPAAHAQAGAHAPQPAAPADVSAVPADAPRGNLLRRHAREHQQWPASPAGVRHLRHDELLSTLSLLQSGRMLPPGDTHALRLLGGIEAVAGALGLDRDSVGLAPEQSEAVAVVGALFDHLHQVHDLGPQTQEALSLLAVPWLYLALTDPQLFEEQAPASMRLLSLLVELWDAVDPDDPAGRELRQLADQAAEAVLDAPHGDQRVFAQWLDRIEAALLPLRRRAEAVERRTWQALRGRERLDAARRQALLEVEQRFNRRQLLPSVGAFLDGEWRQSLTQLWLREGSEGAQYRDLLALGDALLESDALAAAEAGSAVADQLLRIVPQVRACCLQSGAQHDAVEARLARLVAEHARPSPRTLRVPAVLDDEDAPLLPEDIAALGETGASTFEVGQRFVQPHASGVSRQLRLAWRSDLSGAFLLVNGSGLREHLLVPAALHAMVATGQLRPRPTNGAVPAAVAALLARAGGG